MYCVNIKELCIVLSFRIKGNATGSKNYQYLLNLQIYSKCINLL